MDEESKQMIDDCFLRPVLDVSTTNAGIKPPPPKAPVKVELQVLRLNEDSQNLVMETLRGIHGQDFDLGSESAYKDKGSHFKKSYWEERGNLVIQGITDFSNVPKTGSSSEDMMRFYAIRKLESYGFHKNHCQEALEYCKWDIDDALKLLYDKYFPPPSPPGIDPDISATENEIIMMREDEKSALESIYEGNFEEKERNRIWQLKLKIEHLLIYSPSEKKKMELERKKNDNVPKVKKSMEKCRNFARGKCKYGENCRFSHEVDKPPEKPVDKQSQEAENWFYLEVRFPDGCKYPFEAPLVLLKTTYPDFPTPTCLRLMRMLAVEARKVAEDGMPSFYTLAELLQMKEEVEEFLRNDLTPFLNSKLSLFFVPEEVENGIDEKKNLPTHYQKGTTGKSDRDRATREELRRENARLVRKFTEKQTNLSYQNMMKTRQSLPVWDKRKEILGILEKNQVLVISGETGCGKSTQVPQFLLDQWLSSAAEGNNKNIPHVEIICTQPRRLSAIGVAQRVADERVERIGNSVGYQIRLENKISASTRLTFCTTGILLRRLQTDPVLANVTYVIVDEVHERSEESDFLLLILRELLEKRSDLRVILMSATLNAKIFSEYFKGAPVLDIPGRTFPVEQLFLEDIIEQSNYVLEADSQHCRKLKKFFKENVQYNVPNGSLKINPELIESVLVHIVKGEHNWPREGTILIFLPGFAEIQSVHNCLTDNALFSPRAGNFVLVPLHSTLTNEEQSLVFQKLKPPKRKIVLSTNIAETSVTIDDCVFVIDCGHMKEKRFDSNRNMESLELVWVSRANALQRKGRAGRVMSGVAIHLFTRHRMGGAVPRVAQPSELRFKTREDGYVAIHPSSVNSVVGHFNFPFLVFQEKVKTSRIFIRESTMVPLLPLVLFSGSDIKIELHGGDFIILLEDGWIMLQAANHAVAEMVKWLRKELVELLEQKIRDPCLNLLHHENGSRLIGTIVHLLTTE
uniref:RNA helicase n=1 Tax=Lutzomyia longipalpis TaxID=7200 RepID=A0A1B0GJV8_LUTLO